MHTKVARPTIAIAILTVFAAGCEGQTAAPENSVSEAAVPAVEATEQAPAPPIAVATVETAEQARASLLEHSKIAMASGVGRISREVVAGDRLLTAKKEFSWYAAPADPWGRITVELPPPYFPEEMANGVVAAWRLLRNDDWEFSEDRIREAARAAAKEAIPFGGSEWRNVEAGPWRLEVIVNRPDEGSSPARGVVIVQAAEDGQTRSNRRNHRFPGAAQIILKPRP